MWGNEDIDSDRHGQAHKGRSPKLSVPTSRSWVSSQCRVVMTLWDHLFVRPKLQND